ncbi:hypothetical protein Tco_0632849 [Tanacetum coccineum]
MKRTGKDFSRRITPLFDTMMVQPVEEMGEDSDNPTDSTPIPLLINIFIFQPRRNPNYLRRFKDRRQRFLKMRSGSRGYERGTYSRPYWFEKDSGKVGMLESWYSTDKADDLIFDTGVLDDVEMPVEAKVEPEVPLNEKRYTIALDEQIARDIQAKLDAELLEEQKLARKQEEEANIALMES